ncbi:MAG: uL14 family ribosomal protein [Chitinophagaceae bacterium]|nr:uL14 family ribosomal protein [Chitinophagaceae bacterium]
MILKNTVMFVLDKNGVILVNVFHLYGGFLMLNSKFGFFVKISVKKTVFNALVLKKSKLKGVIIQTRFYQKKNDGSFLNYRKNSLILLKRRLISQGIEIFGPCNFLLKRKRFLFSFSGLI